VFGISYFSADGIGSQADVFYTKIASFHGVSSVEPATLLGHAMAHELGHLLLGSNSHSLTGLMRANWRTNDLIHMEQGGLPFSEEQSGKMKACKKTLASMRFLQAGRSYGRRGQTPVVWGTGQHFRCNMISSITNRWPS
jgi:hypothetical protein